MICTACYDNCLTCAGPGAQQCTDCKEGFTLKNRMCGVGASADDSSVLGIVLGVVLPVMFIIGIALVWKLRKVKE